jgi:aspartate/methionine/tyrosine aminotransferase
MNLPPFLLDHWIAKYDFAEPPIAYNLASSTGPRWSVEDLTRLGGARFDVASSVMSYAPAEGSRSLREAVSEFHGVAPDWVVMTTGASEALSIFLCLSERPGGNLVIPDPAYPAYAAMAQVWRLGVRNYTISAAADFVQQAETVLEAVNQDTVAVIVNTPHNPTGSVMATEELARLSGSLAERDVPLVVDEVYHPLYFGPKQPSAAGLENVIVTSDLSKAMSLPGLRTGWIIDRDVPRRKRIVDARSYFTISGSPLLEMLATHALRHRDQILDRLQTVATKNLDLLEALIAGSDGVLSWSRPRGGTTSFPWFTDGSNSRPFCEGLAEQGVLVAPGDCFGHARHMRIGFAQQEDRFQVAVQRIGEKLRDQKTFAKSGLRRGCGAPGQRLDSGHQRAPGE